MVGHREGKDGVGTVPGPVAGLDFGDHTRVYRALEGAIARAVTCQRRDLA